MIVVDRSRGYRNGRTKYRSGETGESRLNEDAVPRLPPASASPPQRTKAGIIEIELGGCCVRVDRDVDAEALQRSLSF